MYPIFKEKSNYSEFLFIRMACLSGLVEFYCISFQNEFVLCRINSSVAYTIKFLSSVISPCTTTMHSQETPQFSNTAEFILH
jgi:hypothetical protein